MKNSKTIWLSFAAAMAFGLVGCSDDGGSGGSGGTAGTGGSGGMEPGTAMVTVVHLAPEVPTAMDTQVDILVNGATAIEGLAYGESTGRVPLDAGMYTFGVAAAGSTDPVISFPATLADGDDLTVIAYRSPEDVVNVFVLSNSTEGLASGEGRVFVGHGADDSLLDPVNIVVVDGEDCTPLIPDLAFGTTAPDDGVLDLAEGTVNIGFDIADDCAPEAGPVPVTVNPDVVSILVAVDEDTADESLDPELWAIIPDISDEPIRLIKTN